MPLSEKAKKIGDREAFPTVIIGAPPGMTYRQWLLGQALAGAGTENANLLASAIRDAFAVTDGALEKLAGEL
jgi:hypothetical protein